MNNIMNSKYLIKSKSGYQPFHGIQKVVKDRSLVFTTTKTKIGCTLTHRFYCGKNSSGKIFRQAKNLKVGDKIDNQVILEIEEENFEQDFYDVLEVRGHTFTGNGIESHNCNIIYTDESAYIKKNLWDEFLDAVIPTMNSLIFKQTINTSTANGMNHFYHLVESSKNKNSNIEEKIIDGDESVIGVGGDDLKIPMKDLYERFQKVKLRRELQSKLQWEFKDV